MVSFVSKFLFTATVTAPTFLSLGLIGVIKDSTNYFRFWDEMLENRIFPTSFEWWGINISFGFMLICLMQEPGGGWLRRISPLQQAIWTLGCTAPA